MIAIKGMKMPKKCYWCPLLDGEYGTCNIIGETKVDMTEKRASNCPLVEIQEPKTGHCKDCKYFEYDSVAKIDGIPLIVAHEICSKWGDGCKTKEDGYCFLFEPQESEE